MGISMFMKGKLSLNSPKTRDIDTIRKMFDKTKNL
jgi:hypothetical protein